mmetsp:Transcript_70320/g.164747  ORF Transcript_70320/g.164747 Transcript_70320/m.164747 type:complete len:234 (+) Transcript_70320:183-884(+)
MLMVSRAQGRLCHRVLPRQRGRSWDDFLDSPAPPRSVQSERSCTGVPRLWDAQRSGTFRAGTQRSRPDSSEVSGGRGGSPLFPDRALRPLVGERTCSESRCTVSRRRSNLGLCFCIHQSSRAEHRRASSSLDLRRTLSEQPDHCECLLLDIVYSWRGRQPHTSGPFLEALQALPCAETPGYTKEDGAQFQLVRRCLVSGRAGDSLFRLPRVLHRVSTTAARACLRGSFQEEQR